MNAETFFKSFDLLAEAPNSVAKLRELILELAIDGKLVPQNPQDDSAELLLKRIQDELAAKCSKKRASSQPPLEALGRDAIPTGIPDSWVVARFGNIVEIIRGITFPSSAKGKTPYDGAVPCLRTSNVQAEIEWHDLLYIPGSYVKNDDQWVLPGDIIISMANSYELVGKVAMVKMPLPNTTFGGFLAAIRTVAMDPDFLMIVLRSPRMQLALRGTSSQTTNIANISLGGIRPIPVPIPPLAEQRRIVSKVDELLGLCDELETRQGARRELRERLVQAALDQLLASQDPADFANNWATLRTHFDILFDSVEAVERLQQAIMHLAVVGKLVRQLPTDQPAAQLLAEIRKAVVKAGKSERNGKVEYECEYPIPESWEWARLGDLTTVMDSGWSPACDDEPTSSEKEWGVLKTTAVQELEFLVHEHKRLPSTLEPRPDAEVQPGDILITRAGPKNRVGICCLVPEVRRNLMLSDKIIRIHFVDDLLSRDFMALCLNAGPSRDYLDKAKSGMAESQMNVSQVKLRDTPIPIPPLAEQRRIIARVTELISICRDLTRQLSSKTQHSSSLLTAAIPDLLTARPQQSRTSGAAPGALIRDELLISRGSIVSYAIRRVQQRGFFGETKLVKALYVAQNHLGIALKFVFERHPYGPLPREFYPFQSQAANEGWFFRQEREKGGFTYHPGPNHEEACNDAQTYLKTKQSEFDRLVDHILRLSTDDAELFATAYAAWNDLLIDGRKADEDAIIAEIHGWHEGKKTKFSPSEIRKRLDWMRTYGYVPSGQGERTKLLETPTKRRARSD